MTSIQASHHPPTGHVFSRTTTLGDGVAVLVVTIALVGFHISTPIIVSVFGEKGSPGGVSIEFVTSVPLVLFTIGGMLLLLRRRSSRRVLAAYSSFVAWVLLGSYFMPPSAYRELLTPLSHIGIMCGAALLFHHHWPALRRRLPFAILLALSCFLAWFAWGISTGSVEVEHADLWTEVERHSIGGMRSTEVTMLLGPQLCYLLYLWNILRGGLRPFVLGLILLNIASMFFYGARGPIGGMVIVFALFFLSGDVQRRLRVICIVGLFIAVVTGIVAPYVRDIGFETTSLLASGDNIRSDIYSALWGNALEFPFFGIGHTQFAYNRLNPMNYVCHHNVLGRCCENGFPAGFFYLLFIISSFVALRGVHRMRHEPNEVTEARLFLQACLWIFAYQQFRGLFQDTWQLKEIAFVVGAGMGLHAWMEDHEPCAALVIEEQPEHS